MAIATKSKQDRIMWASKYKTENWTHNLLPRRFNTLSTLNIFPVGLCEIFVHIRLLRFFQFLMPGLWHVNFKNENFRDLLQKNVRVIPCVFPNPGFV
jgi:hypothetical protein